MSRQVRVQDLMGRRVRDADGKVIGRIMEISATVRGKECTIDSYHLGATAFLQRLGIGAGRLIGLSRSREPQKIPWQELDLSDPERPVLRPSPPRNSRG
jgi:sporulation protein YlmC with PRC-barrel domain